MTAQPKMRTTFKFISFQQKWGGWQCQNNKTSAPLGFVSYYSKWKQWVFEPSPHCIFSCDCMADIITFIGQLDKDGKTNATD